MDNSHHNCKIKDQDLLIQVRAGIVCNEPQEPEELEVYLELLQNLAKAMMAQLAIYRQRRSLYANTIEGLEKDLEETNRDIDNAQKILMQYRQFQHN